MVRFWVKEAFKLIGRARFSFILTLISLTLAVIVIEASIVALQLSVMFQKKIKSNINVSVFIKDPFNGKEIENFKSELASYKFIRSFRYVSKDDAAKSFIKETGEDFREILDYNPLPASFVVKLDPNVLDKDSLSLIIKSLSKLEWVDEVIFRNKFVYKLLSYVDSGKKYLIIITGVLIFIAVYLVYSTVKLITNARMSELETMKLVGARLLTIKMPIILNSFITGLIASLLAVAVYYLVSIQADNYQLVNNFIIANRYFYLFSLLTIGPALSFLVTIVALRKLTLKI